MTKNTRTWTFCGFVIFFKYYARTKMGLSSQSSDLYTKLVSMPLVGQHQTITCFLFLKHIRSPEPCSVQS